MEINNLRILFMGTPEIAATVLKAMIKEHYQVVGVVTQPDRPIGRKQLLTPSEVKKVALDSHLPVYTPVKIRKEYDFVQEINPDIIIVIAYGQILPEGLLNIPKYGCLNLHGSLLPKYRGAAPIQYALIHNEKITGMSLMEMTKAMDAGKVYATKEIAIEDNDNATSLFLKMGQLASALLLESLPLYIKGELKGVPQDENLVTFAPSIKPEEEHIDLNKSIEDIYGSIRGLAEQPGAYLLLNDEKIKIFKSSIINHETQGEVGQIIKADKNGLFLQCKDGVLSILELQKSGKNKMDYKSFINGNKNLLGKVLK